MFAALLEGLFQVLAWPALLYLFVGVGLGLFVGFVPGLGGPAALAIMIPITFTLADEPASAIGLLLGLHAVTNTGGSISAILFGVPGTAPNAATVLDGFEMTKRGEGGRAIGAALSASAIGGLFGAVVLALLVPFMRPIVLSFGPVEFFFLTVLGLSFLSTIGTGDPMKAGAGAILGLLLSFIGQEHLVGTYRYTFGSVYLSDGLSLIPVLLGLFAVAEMASLLVGGGAISKVAETPEHLGRIWQGVRDTLGNWWLVVRSSFLGSFIGMLPGLGGDVACFIAYGHAAQTCKDKDEFGTGSVLGVIAPEAANNAKEGGALFPTLGFGIPGSAGMAILLGVFLILGLDPGPEMLSTNLDITFSMVWTVVLANLLAVVLVFPFIRYLVKVTFLDGRVLAPIILLTSAVGAYSASQNFNDLVIVLIFGMLGYEMKRLHYSRPALLLGFILGGIAERSLFLALRTRGLGVFLQPSSIIFICIIMAVVGFPIWKYARRRYAHNTE